MSKCWIIGVLDDGVAGLTAEAQACLEQADLVIGGTRVLQLLTTHLSENTEQRDLTGQLTQVPNWIERALATDKEVVVLASGDPLCYGIVGFLRRHLPEQQLEVIGNRSNIQVAFERLCLPWQDALRMSLHGKDRGEWSSNAGADHPLSKLLCALYRHRQIALLTDPHNSPARVARMLIQVGLDDQVEMVVAEQLNQPDEQIHQGLSVQQIAQTEFAQPNLLLLLQDQLKPRPALFGLADDHYAQRKPDKGLITKQEVRAVSLAKLALRRDSIVWDIGAGSGSLGLEAARLCDQGWVYAMEKNSADAPLIEQNRHQAGVGNYSLNQGKAPAGLEQWPPPHAVFIGGSGGQLEELISYCTERLQPEGRLVINLVLLENLNTALNSVKSLNLKWDLTQMQVSRSRPLLDGYRLQPESPVWILSVEKSV